MKNHENQLGTMKNHENQPETMKTRAGISKNVTNTTFLLYIDLKAKVEAYSVQSRKTE